MALSDKQIDALIAKGLSDEEIAALNDEDDDERESRPRTVSDWKRKARAEAARAAEMEARLSSFERRESFRDLHAQLPEDVRSLVSYEDVKDEPKLSVTHLKVVAESKREAQRAERLNVAKSYGFESVEQFDQAFEQFKQAYAQEQQVQQQNRDSYVAQANVGAAAAAPGQAGGAQARVRQAADAGDVDAIFETITANPGAFAMTGPASSNNR